MSCRHMAQLELLAGLLAPGLPSAMQRPLNDITSWVLAPMFGTPAPTPPRPRPPPKQAPCNRSASMQSRELRDLMLPQRICTWVPPLPFGPVTVRARCGWLCCCLDATCCRQVPR